MTYFSDQQIELLLKPINPRRVSNLRGLSYVEGYDVRAELTRIFGFGRWSEETMDQQLICENETKTSKGGNAWYVVYRTRVRLTVYAPDGELVTFYDGAHIGSSTHPERGEAHGNALTNSQTYALRRCAINLGDQFGLGLYNKGSLDPIVRWTLVRPEAVAADTDDVPTVTPEATAAEPAEETSAKLPVTPRRSPVRKEAPPVEPLSLQDIILKISEAKTVDELRVAWKDAGTAGVLQTSVVLANTGEKMTVQECLYKRNDELSPRKSNDTGDSDTGENAGEGKDGK